MDIVSVNTCVSQQGARTYPSRARTSKNLTVMSAPTGGGSLRVASSMPTRRTFRLCRCDAAASACRRGGCDAPQRARAGAGGAGALLKALKHPCATARASWVANGSAATIVPAVRTRGEAARCKTRTRSGTGLRAARKWTSAAARHAPPRLARLHAHPAALLCCARAAAPPRAASGAAVGVLHLHGRSAAADAAPTQRCAADCAAACCHAGEFNAMLAGTTPQCAAGGWRAA